MSTPPGCAQHVALFPGAGMGHLIPFLRLAAILSSRGCQVTLITAHPTVSLAESNHLSDFLSSHSAINHHHFHLLPISSHPSSTPIIDDPFFNQVYAIRRSLNNIRPILLQSASPFSTLVIDILLADRIAAVLSDLPPLPNYILCTSSARFLALMSRLGSTVLPADYSAGDVVDIPGLTTPVSKSSIPPPFTNPDHFFHALLLDNARAFPLFDGILVNTFSGLEGIAVRVLNSGSVMQGLPPVLPIGPLPPIIHFRNQKQLTCTEWLDTQPASSVVLLSFGSRTAMSKDQIQEIAKALITSKFAFVWIVKGSKVDRDDKDDLTKLLGEPFLKIIKSSRSGMVVNEWVNQESILSHSAIGGFVSHCGWNSVTEAAARGVPVLAWPLHGDQKLNAEVVVEAGLGIWDESWGWGGERVVAADEIQRKLVELMEDVQLKRMAASVGAEARRAVDVAGSSDLLLTHLVNRDSK
ncbi:unnamed protein product [Rhodiola kirilowii]